jgi:23S rRNA (adenosine1067-2'-O)-methyltransferase
MVDPHGDPVKERIAVGHEPVLRDAMTSAQDVIASTRHPAARRIADVLKRAQGTPRTVLLEDEQIIDQALRAGLTIDSAYFPLRAPGARERLQRVVPPDVPLHGIVDEVLDALFGPTKQARVFALGRGWRPPRLASLTDRRGDLVILDGVRLAGNIGAVTRSASAFDAAGVVLIASGLTSVVDRRLVRASRGFVFTIPVVIASREHLLQYLQQEGIPLVALVPQANTDLEEVRRLDRRVAFLLGSERTGVSAELGSYADHVFRIPVQPEVESLNVSVAAAIALYERHQTTLAGAG